MPSFTTCCWPKRRSRLFRLAVDSAAKGHHETSAPTSSASSRWRCRTAGCLSGRKGASLSVAAGASSALHQVAGRTSPQGPEQSRHRKVRNFLQRDAAFYPGDSGGLTGPCAVANSSASTLLSLALARPLRPWSGHSNRHGALRVDRIIETGDLRRGNFAISFEFQAPVAGNADAVWYGRSFHNGCHTGCGFGLAGKQEQLEQLNIFGPKRAVHLARFLLQYNGHGAFAGQAALR